MFYIHTKRYKDKAYLKDFEKNMTWIPLGYSDKDCCNYYKCPCCGRVIDDWHYPTNVDSITCKCEFEGKLI